MAMIRPRFYSTPTTAPTTAPSDALPPGPSRPGTLTPPAPASTEVPAAPPSNRDPNLQPGEVVGTLSAYGGTAEVSGEPEQPAAVEEVFGSYDNREDAFAAARRFGLERGTTASVISKDDVYSAVLLDETARRGFRGRHIEPAGGVQVEGHARDGNVYGPVPAGPLPLPDRPGLLARIQSAFIGKSGGTPPAGVQAYGAEAATAAYAAHRESWCSHASAALSA